MNFKILFS